LRIVSEVFRDSIVTADLSIVSCELASGAALLNLDSGIYYSLNEIGARIWTLVQAPKSVDDICHVIEGHYDVTPERCYSDLVTVLAHMAEAGLVKISDAQSS
jgi:hypothetical protein